MPKTPKKSNSLVPATPSSKALAGSKGTASTPKPIEGRNLGPLVGSKVAAGKLVGDEGTVSLEGGVTLVTGRAYATRDQVVPAEAIFFDRDAKPHADGPWLGEADKVCWRDEASGYDCIMMRERTDGHLRGFVGIPKDHPLWGWEDEAVPPDLGIEVHGGLDYAQECQNGPSPTLHAEMRRICHVSETIRARPLDAVGTPTNANAWWFGFSCDQPYDLVPNKRSQATSFMQAEIGQQYRDDAYVVREIAHLAAQLRAIADGGEMPRRSGPTPPPIGLDPRRGGRA